MKEKIKEFIIKNLKWIILFICLVSFLILTKDVFNKEILKGDIIGYKIISDFFISDAATPMAKFITNFGGVVGLIAVSMILFICIKNKKIVTSIFANLFIVTMLNLILKNLLQRPRPNEYRIINETGYSFPSGHSMVSMAFYGFIIYLISKYVKNKYLKISLITFLILLIALIGISRIYLGVHYTSDVIAGFLISVSYLIIYISAVNRFILERDKKMDLRRKRIVKVESKKLVNSFKYAGKGFISSFKSERNMKIHIIIMFLIIILGILLKINKAEWITCIICFAIVISGELFNTTIEIVVDMITPYKDEKAKLAKDISASGVLVLAIGTAIVGSLIFVPKILEIVYKIPQ